MMFTMTSCEQDGKWSLNGVPDAALQYIKEQPYGSKVLDALSYLAAIEKIAAKQEEWKKPDDFTDLHSGQEVLVYYSGCGPVGGYSVLTFFEAGDELFEEVPVSEVKPEEASPEQKLLISLFGKGLEGYKKVAKKSGFYTLDENEKGYVSWRLIPDTSLAGWQPLPVPPTSELTTE